MSTKKGQCVWIKPTRNGSAWFVTPSKNSYSLRTFDWITIEIEYKMSLSTGWCVSPNLTPLLLFLSTVLSYNRILELTLIITSKDVKCCSQIVNDLWRKNTEIAWAPQTLVCSSKMLDFVDFLLTFVIYLNCA